VVGVPSMRTTMGSTVLTPPTGSAKPPLPIARTIGKSVTPASVDAMMVCAVTLWSLGSVMKNGSPCP
jgi:hypothetical protein